MPTDKGGTAISADNRDWPSIEAAELTNHLPEWAMWMPIARDRHTLVVQTQKGQMTCNVRRLVSTTVSLYQLRSAISYAAFWGEDENIHGLVLIVNALTKDQSEDMIDAWKRVHHRSRSIRYLLILPRVGGCMEFHAGSDIPRTDLKEAKQKELRPDRSIDPKLHFTDANSYLLKHLIYSTMSAFGGSSLDEKRSRWGGPMEEIRSLMSWAELCGVARQTAYRLADALEYYGFLKDPVRSGRPVIKSVIRPASCGKLLTMWLNDNKPQERKRIGIAPLFENKEKSKYQGKLDWVKFNADFLNLMNKEKVVLSGWSALNYHGISTVGNSDIPTLSVRNESTLHVILSMNEMRRVKSTSSDAWAFISVAEQPRSVFEGAIWTNESLGVVDLWQAALDIVDDPNRGREHAEQILELLLHRLPE